METQKLKLSQSTKTIERLFWALFLGFMVFSFLAPPLAMFLFVCMITVGIFWASSSVKKDNIGKLDITKLINDDKSLSDYTNLQTIMFEDFGDAMLIASDQKIVKTYQMNGNDIDIVTFGWNEIEKVELFTKPDELEVQGDNSSQLKLIFGGTLVGGVTGLVTTGIITSLYSDYKKYEGILYVFIIKFYLRGRKKPIEVRAIQRRCQHPTTSTGEEQLKQVIQEAGTYLKLVNKNFSEMTGNASSKTNSQVLVNNVHADHKHVQKNVNESPIKDLGEMTISNHGDDDGADEKQRKLNYARSELEKKIKSAKNVGRIIIIASTVVVIPSLFALPSTGFIVIISVVLLVYGFKLVKDSSNSAKELERINNQ